MILLPAESLQAGLPGEAENVPYGNLRKDHRMAYFICLKVHLLKPQDRPKKVSVWVPPGPKGLV